MDANEELPEKAEARLLVASRNAKRRVWYMEVDLFGDDGSIDQAFEDLVPDLRHPVRGLVACKEMRTGGPALELDIDSMGAIIQMNAAVTLYIATKVAHEMQECMVGGSIVLLAGISGYVANKGIDDAAYNSSKAAVLQGARSLAAEWGSRKGRALIRVNTLSPGHILTPALEERTRDGCTLEAQYRGDNMLYRISTVDEYRAPVIFLLSDGSSFMTGADLRVDGGHCAW